MHVARVVSVVLALGCIEARAWAQSGAASAPAASRRWSAADAELVAKSFVAKCFAGGWLTAFQQAKGHEPSVRVLPLRNRSDEHIDIRDFSGRVSALLGPSSKVKLLPETAAASDYVISGWIVDVPAEEDTYSVTLRVGGVDDPAVACQHHQTIRKSRPAQVPGEWNSEDAESVAKSFFAKCFGDGRTAAFSKESDRRPSIRILGLRNRTTEHIQGRDFTGRLGALLVQSSKVRLYPEPDEAEGDAQKQEASDYTVAGWITVERDAFERRVTSVYRVSLSVEDVKDSHVACQHNQSIRKVVLVKPEEESAEWDFADADRVAKAFIAKCLSDRWLAAFQRQHGRQPAIRVFHTPSQGAVTIRAYELDDRLTTGTSPIAGKVTILAEACEGAAVLRAELAGVALNTCKMPSDYDVTGRIIPSTTTRRQKVVASYAATLRLGAPGSTKVLCQYDQTIHKTGKSRKATSEW